MKFPRGLRPIGDAAHRHDMKFILWFEPERATGNSAIAKQHPDWVLHVNNQDRVSNILDPSDGLLNLGNPAARRWLTDEISRRLQQWGVDVFRIDCNIDLACFWRAADARPTGHRRDPLHRGPLRVLGRPGAGASRSW